MPVTMQQIQVHIHNRCCHFVGKPLFLAGNFNNWSPKHIEIGTIPNEGQSFTYLLDNPHGEDLELKVSRGDWDTLSCDQNGKLQASFCIEPSGNKEIHITIDAWRDQFPKSTASKQVHLLDSKFYFPKLNTHKKIWIYLPRQYESSKHSYPVLYMHDGQHLFDEATSLGRSGPLEWMVDETIDNAETPSIVVAIEHAESNAIRKEEYLVHPSQDIDSVKGWLYLEDLVHTVKPYIDRHFRTKNDIFHTAIAGGSIGALLSMYAGLKYPQIFGTIAAFSPSIWIDAQNLYTFSRAQLNQNYDLHVEQNIYLYTGDKEKRLGLAREQNHMQIDIELYYSWLHHNYPGQAHLDIGVGSKHGALYWQQAFRNFYAFWQNKLHFYKQINNSYEHK